MEKIIIHLYGRTYFTTPIDNPKDYTVASYKVGGEPTPTHTGDWDAKYDLGMGRMTNIQPINIDTKEKVEIKFKKVSDYHKYVKTLFNGGHVYNYFGYYHEVSVNGLVVGEVFQDGDYKWQAIRNGKLIGDTVKTRKAAAEFLLSHNE